MGNLLTSSQYFYQSYPSVYKAMNMEEGNFAPFSMEVLQALAPAFKDNTAKALDQLYRLYNRVSKELHQFNADAILRPSSRVLQMKARSQKVPAKSVKSQNAKKENESEHDSKSHSKISLATWCLREMRVLLLIVTCHASRKEYPLAIQLLEKILQHYKETPNSHLDEESQERLATIQSMLGCLYLQAGIVQEGLKHFKQVETTYGVFFEEALQQNQLRNDVLVRIYLNRGYAKFATGQYLPAYEQFQQVLKLDPCNVSAANNRAITLLYTCNLTKAIESLEEFIRTDPNKVTTVIMCFDHFRHWMRQLFII